MSLKKEKWKLWRNFRIFIFELLLKSFLASLLKRKHGATKHLERLKSCLKISLIAISISEFSHENHNSHKRIFIQISLSEQFGKLYKMENCAVCGISAGQKCSGCNERFYCSKDHQRVDWKAVHKNDCKCYDVITDLSCFFYFLNLFNV